LQIAATTGLLGLAAYIGIFASYFYHSYRYGGWPLAALSGGVLAYILQLQLSFPSAASNVAFWGLLGSSVAIMRLQAQGDEPLQETTKSASVEMAETPRAKAFEGLVVLVVFIVLISLALPAFLDQREKAAKAARDGLILNVSRSVDIYEQARESGRAYPEAGVYTSYHPIKAGAGLKFRPSVNVRITTTTSGGRFRVEGESTTLAGSFKTTYDSATDKYSTNSS
jgi:type II secretory pathway pseudopilin PulG